MIAESVFTGQIVTWLLHMECKQLSFEHTLHSRAPEPAVTLAEYKTVHGVENHPGFPGNSMNEWQDNKPQKRRERVFSFLVTQCHTLQHRNGRSLNHSLDIIEHKS